MSRGIWLGFASWPLLATAAMVAGIVWAWIRDHVVMVAKLRQDMIAPGRVWRENERAVIVRVAGRRMVGFALPRWVGRRLTRSGRMPVTPMTVDYEARKIKRRERMERLSRSDG